MKFWHILLLPFLACRPQPPVPPEPDIIDVDASIPTCHDWCARATELACPAARPTARGSTCDSVCESVMRSGIIVWDLRCRVAARTCNEADACEAGR